MVATAAGRRASARRRSAAAVAPERPANSSPLAPRNIHTDTERAGSRLIPPRSIRLAGILMNGRARCHVPAPGTAVPQALTARIQYHPDTVQCVRIADRVTIHDDYISVELYFRALWGACSGLFTENAPHSGLEGVRSRSHPERGLKSTHTQPARNPGSTHSISTAQNEYVLEAMTCLAPVLVHRSNQI
jgi:hypothetical protein